ncbi:MAG: PEP-CTERM sorting domain-containing protein [Propionivibrio sp.]|nr:PEP-CTERM sorting domain-containing protein [Propionivibrio sp.]
MVSGTTTATVLSGSSLAAASVVSMSNGLEVTHTYSYAAGGLLFKVHVAMANTTAGSLSDVRYARTLDWDVPPGHFSDDFTTVRFSALGGKLFSTSTNPFAVPDPLVTRTQDKDINITDTPGDKGSFFIFKFGDLAAGEKTEFDTYIGAAGTTKELVDALNGVGAEAYSYTFDNDTPATYGYGFVGIGLPPVEPPTGVPEPGTLALASLALLGMGGMRRRKSA